MGPGKEVLFASLILLHALCTGGLASNERLVALTFDDGPRPYVLLDNGTSADSPGLLHVLDTHQVKATFFVMGWRLQPGAYDRDHPTRIKVTYREAAQELIRRGHEIENHTYSHVMLPAAERKYGEGWALADVDRASWLIQDVTGSRPIFVRPPSWVIREQQRRELESHGYHIMSLSGHTAPAVRDVNSEDYFCAGKNLSHCPKPSLEESVFRQIEQRERKGVYTHILVFHELPSSVVSLDRLIPELQQRGYRFVRLDEYEKMVKTRSSQ